MSNGYFIPQISFVESGLSKTTDPFSFLLNQRVIFLSSALDSISSAAIIAQLLSLEKLNPTDSINFYINSTGCTESDIIYGLAIYDAMLAIKPLVNTFCIGQCCGVATFLLAAGTGARVATPHSRIIINQVLSTTKGQVSDILLQADEVARLNALLVDIIYNNTGCSFDELAAPAFRTRFLSPADAKKIGLIDSVLETAQVK